MWLQFLILCLEGCELTTGHTWSNLGLDSLYLKKLSHVPERYSPLTHSALIWEQEGLAEFWFMA